MIGSVADFRNWCAGRMIEIPEEATNSVLESSLVRATGILESLLTRRLTPVSAATHIVTGNGTTILALPDFISITGITCTNETLAENTAYVVRPYGESPKYLLERIDGGVWLTSVRYTVAGTLGYKSVIPTEIIHAAYALVGYDVFNSESNAIKSISIQGISVTLNTASEMYDDLKRLLIGHVRTI